MKLHSGKISINVREVFSVVSLLLLAGVFLIPVMVDNELHDALRAGKIFFFVRYMLLLVPVGLFFFICNRKQAIYMQTFFVLVWFAWIILRGKIGGVWYDEKFFWWSGCFALYFVIEQILFYTLKNVNRSFIYIPVVSLVLIAGVEALLGTLQIYDKFHIYNGLFKVSGTFFNPAPYAGFLVASFPFALFLSSLRSNNKILQVISLVGYVVICLIIIVIPATRSRAAYLGFAAGFIVWFFFRYRPIELLKSILNSRLKRALAFSITPVLIVTILLGLYLFKKDSASGRLLIWKVAFNTIKEQPLTGNGFNTIQATMAPAQAAYFASGQGTEQEEYLADSVKWAFNVFLQTASETGWIGLLIMLVVIIQALLTKPKVISNENQYLLFGAARATLVAILIFGCFSYPFYSLPIAILMFLSLALISSLSSQRKVELKLLNYLVKGFIPLVLLVLWIFYFIREPELEKGYWLWNEAEKMYQIQAYEEANESFAQSNELLPNNGLLLQHYGKNLYMKGDYAKAIQVLETGGFFYKDEFWYLTLGDCYFKTGEYNLAERCYLKASQIVPGKFYPEYLLAKLYDETGQTEKAISKANHLLKKEAKVQSQAVHEIKKEMKTLVDKNKTKINVKIE